MKESAQTSKLSIISGYLLGLPALYTVLTSGKKDTLRFFHADKALRMWIWFFIWFFALRFAINLIWLIVYIPYLDKLEILLVLYLAYCAIKAAMQSQKE